MRAGGIVLCGGQSSRMGLPKATLPFGPEPLLARVVRLLGEAVDPIVVVAAPRQDIPPLPASVHAVRDRREGRGPLEGLSAGLAALAGECDAVYATSCDAPLLKPAFVRRMLDLLGGFEIAVPLVEGQKHPLSAVYRPGVLSVIDALLAEDRLRVMTLFERASTRVVEAAELADVDPRFDTLRNLNAPTNYIAALTGAGYTVPVEVLAALKENFESLPGIEGQKG